MNLRQTKCSVALVMCLVLLVGCVERTITIRSLPAGALVTVNEVEKGRTPVTFPFTWYGDYRVLIEQPGYQPLETHRATNAPIYQWPVLDFISEVLLPFKFHDHHEWSFNLAPRRTFPAEELIGRAVEFRDQAHTPADHDVPLE